MNPHGDRSMNIIILLKKPHSDTSTINK